MTKKIGYFDLREHLQYIVIVACFLFIALISIMFYIISPLQHRVAELESQLNITNCDFQNETETYVDFLKGDCEFRLEDNKLYMKNCEVVTLGCVR